MYEERGYTQNQIKDILGSVGYFNKVFKKSFPQLKFPKKTRMGKCEECVMLRY